MSNSSFQHFVSLLLSHAQQKPQQVAIRQKQFGLWHTWSWHDVLEISEHYANALHGYGFKKNQSILLLSQLNIDVIAISLAVQALGGKIQFVGTDLDTLTSEQILQYFQQLQPEYAVVEHLEQLIPLQQFEDLPLYIFYLQQNHLTPPEYEHIVSSHQLLAKNQDQDQIKFENLLFEKQQIAFSFERFSEYEHLQVSYRHQELIAQAQQMAQLYQLDSLEQAFVASAFGNVQQMRYVWSVWLYVGFTLNLPETLETLDQNQQVIAPTVLFGTQFDYEQLYHLILQRLPSERSIYSRIFQRILNTQDQRLILSWSEKWVLGCFRQVILEEFGLSYLKTAVVIGDPVSDAAQAFYAALRINLCFWESDPVWHSQSNLAERLTSMGLEPVKIDGLGAIS